MDKNTLTGLLLMGAVLFGFMYCNRSSQEQHRQAATEQQADATAEAVSKPLTGDSLRGEMAKYVRSAGTLVDSAARTYALTTNAFDLRADSTGNVSGSVVLGETKTIVDSIIAAPAGAPVLARVMTALNNERAYKGMAQFMDTEAKAETITLGDKNLKVTFSSRGGRIASVTLPGYKTETTTPPSPITLFTDSTNSYSFEFTTVDQQRVNTDDLNFKAARVNDSTVRMSLPLPDGAELAFVYTVIPDKYIVKMDIEQHNMESVIPTTVTTMRMLWHQTMMRNEKGRTFEERNSAIYYKLLNESPEDLSAHSDEKEKLQGSIKWIGFKNQFFSSVLIARKNLATAEVASSPIKGKEDEPRLKEMSMDATFEYSSKNEQVAGFDFYFGPNDYPLLSSLDDVISPDEDLELTRLVPLGWGLFRWINKFVVIPVFSFLSGFISNYGIIILLLTIFIKLILFPFTYKSYMSQAKMRVLAPEIKEINEKYPGQENAMKRQQETMKLYSRAGASPLSGCLPLLLQMPVLIAMFSFFPSAIELRGQSFLWAHDLAAPDVILTLPFNIPFYGSHVSLFCLLMTVVNIIYTRINMQNQPGGTSMPGMKWMMYLMPVMFLFFFNDYASGLSYYYFLSLLITIIQTYIFRRCVSEEKVRAQMLENAKKPRKKSGFMARLEAAQKKQEALMREQAKQNAKRRR